MDRSLKRGSVALLVTAAALASAALGCAADPIPPPTSPDDPSNPGAPEAPLPPPLSIMTDASPKATATATPESAPPAHHHHGHSSGGPMK